MTPGQKRTLVGAVLILLLGAGMRIFHLGGRTLWYDEAFSVLFAEKSIPTMVEGTLDQETGVAAEEHPLLYYIGLHGWMWLTGQSPQAVRAFSVLAGVLTLAVAFRLTADLFGTATGLVALALVGIAPLHIQYSQETRMYALMTLWLLLSTWCFVRGLHGTGLRWWPAFSMFSTLSLYTHSLSAFYLGALAALPLLSRRWDKVARVLMAGLLVLLLYLPWLVNLPSQLAKVQSDFWHPRPDLVQILGAVFVLTMPFQNARALALFVVAVPVGVIAIAFVMMRAYHVRRSLDWRSGLVLWLAFAPPALMLAVGQFVPVFLQRAMLGSVLVFFVALAWLLTRGNLPRPIAAILVGMWVFACVTGLHLHYTWDTFPHSPFDEVVAYLDEATLPEDVIIHRGEMTLLPMIYYGPHLPVAYIVDPQSAGLAPATRRALGTDRYESPCEEVAVYGHARVWFVGFHGQNDTGQGPFRSPLAWLQEHYTQADLVHFNDLDVYLFVEPDAAARAAEYSP